MSHKYTQNCPLTDTQQPTDVASQTMGDPQRALDAATRALSLAATSIAQLKEQTSEAMSQALARIHGAHGKVVVTGVGKSAHVGAKLAATLNSTGTSAMHIHAGEALHGDLGAIASNDVVLCLSKSGHSEEIAALIPALKQRGCFLIAMTAKPDSTLGSQADLVLDMGRIEEACPFDLAPTTSTSVQMALGDALAVGLMTLSGFQPQDFARNHPAGTLGKRLTWTLAQLVEPSRKPEVRGSDSMQAVLSAMSEGGYGATVVTHDDGGLAGIITDGDLRRAMANRDIRSMTALELAHTNPTVMEGSTLAAEAAHSMHRLGIGQVIVTQDGAYVGMVHVHDFMRHGLT